MKLRQQRALEIVIGASSSLYVTKVLATTLHDVSTTNGELILTNIFVDGAVAKYMGTT